METIIVSIIVGVITVVGLAAAAIARESYATDAVKGIGEASSALIGATGACYVEEGQALSRGCHKEHRKHACGYYHSPSRMRRTRRR
jgi:hypothetical protein